MTAAYVRLLWTGNYLSATPIFEETVAAMTGGWAWTDGGAWC